MSVEPKLFVRKLQRLRRKWVTIFHFILTKQRLSIRNCSQPRPPADVTPSHSSIQVAAPCPWRKCPVSRTSALRLMTWTNNFSKTFLIFASLIPFFRLIIPEKCFYQWILCHNFVYMKKFPWFLSFELGARQACDRRHRTMGTVHSGKISHLTWTFTKKYWAVLGCTGLYWAVLGHLRYLLGNVQVKWRILPLCSV